MSLTESRSCTSKLGLDVIGEARRVLNLPHKSLLFLSCGLHVPWLLPSCAAPLELQKCFGIAQSSNQKKRKGFSLAVVPCCGPTCTPCSGVGAAEQRQGVCAPPRSLGDPPFFETCTISYSRQQRPGRNSTEL